MSVTAYFLKFISLFHLFFSLRILVNDLFVSEEQK